jgi:hypothetical protein
VHRLKGVCLDPNFAGLRRASLTRLLQNLTVAAEERLDNATISGQGEQL